MNIWTLNPCSWPLYQEDDLMDWESKDDAAVFHLAAPPAQQQMNVIIIVARRNQNMHISSSTSWIMHA